MQRKTKNVAAAFALASALTVTGGCAVMDSQVQSNADFFPARKKSGRGLTSLKSGWISRRCSKHWA